MIVLLVIYGIIALVFGGVLAFMGIAVIIDWRDNKADVEQRGYDEGYKAGCRQRFRDRCEYERRARELEREIDRLEGEVNERIQAE